MKRSVAIVGPTPMFVRWSLEQRCDLRQIDRDNLPDSTFRQLRGVREYSVATSEDRVFEDVCVHPAANADQIEQATGFGKDEVLAMFGGEASVTRSCEACSANVDNANGVGANLWAGCYGWLAVDGSSFANGSTVSGDSPSKQPDFLIREIDHVVGMLNIRPLVEANFPVAQPIWYSFWQNRILKIPQLLLLEKIFSAVLRRHESQASEPFVDDLLRLIDAMTISHRQRIPLHVELVPCGVSDGLDWTLAPHCLKCKYSTPDMDANWSQCPACGTTGQLQRVRKFKVLGSRPYVHLVQMMRADPTRAFLQRYEARFAKADGSGKP